MHSLVFILFFIILWNRVEGQVDGDLRLSGINSNAYQGRVEIYKDGTWGTVCSRHFASPEAQVVCRQLGVPESNIAGSVAILDGRFGVGNGQIFIDDVRCHGYENRLLNCMFSFWTYTCDDTSHAAVSCTAPPITTSSPQRTSVANVPSQPSFTAGPPSNSLSQDYGQCVNTQVQQARIVGPQSTTGAGVVQVLINGQWRGISDDCFNRAAAQVICRMLCYDVSKAVPGSDPFNVSTIPSTVVLDDVNCTGSESTITNCAFSTSFTNTKELARVTCVDMATSTLTDSIQPPPLECDNGEITAIFNASWPAYVPNSQVSLVRQSTICNARRQLLTDSIRISIPFDECGTGMTWNSTHILYENSVLYVPAPVGIITRIRTYMLYLTCELPRDYQAQRDLIPISSSMEQSGQGNFTVWMYFYSDNFNTRVTQYPLQVPVGDWLQVGLEMFEYDRNVKLILYSCWATPSSDRNHQIGYPLFTDKCVDDPTVTLFCLTNLQFGFRYQTFKFTQYNEVHIHCEAYVCPLDDTSPECDCTCYRNTARRKKRDINRRWIDVKSSVIMMYDPAENQNNFAQYGPTPPSHTTPPTTGLVSRSHETLGETAAQQGNDSDTRETNKERSDKLPVTSGVVEDEGIETQTTSRLLRHETTMTTNTHLTRDNEKEAINTKVPAVENDKANIIKDLVTSTHSAGDDTKSDHVLKPESATLAEDGIGSDGIFEGLVQGLASGCSSNIPTMFQLLVVLVTSSLLIVVYN